MSDGHSVKFLPECTREITKVAGRYRDFKAYVAAELEELKRRLDVGDQTTPPRYRELSHDLAGISEIRKTSPAARIYYMVRRRTVWVLLCDPNKGRKEITTDVKNKLKKRRKDVEDASSEGNA